MSRLKKISGDDVVQIKTPYGLLANNIIIQAISDWENMVTGVLHETAKINFGELRVFFSRRLLRCFVGWYRANRRVYLGCARGYEESKRIRHVACDMEEAKKWKKSG